jgi:hypothetical protein
MKYTGLMKNTEAFRREIMGTHLIAIPDMSNGTQQQFCKLKLACI